MDFGWIINFELHSFQSRLSLLIVVLGNLHFDVPVFSATLRAWPYLRPLCD